MDKIIRLRNIRSAFKIDPNDSVSSYLVSGRVAKVRAYKSFSFLDLNDGSCKDDLQVIVPKTLLPRPQLGSYLSCRGSLISSKGRLQKVEFKVDKLDFVGECDPSIYPVPLTEYQTNEDWFRSKPHIRPRRLEFASMLRLRSELEFSLHLIMKQMDFFRVQTPILSSNDSEASSDLFTVERTKLSNQGSSDMEQTGERSDVGKMVENDITANSTTSDSLHHKAQRRMLREGYFKKDVFLVTSAQLHLESLAASLSRVYTLSQAFRAENSLTRRHLCEFSMLEAEESNLVSLDRLMDRVETIIKFTGQYLSQVSDCKDDFSSLLERNSNARIFDKLINKNYIRMDYDEALDILRKTSSKSDSDEPLAYGQDIGRRDEKKLLEYTNDVPIFITNFPIHLKPFYMKSDENRQRAQCFDLIAPHGGEICGASLREDSYDRLKFNIGQHLAGGRKYCQPLTPSCSSAVSSFASEGAVVSKISPSNEAKGETSMERYLDADELSNDFGWYLDLRLFGTFPHGGFGIGVERLLQTILGIKNIKDTVAFPRWAGHCPM